MKSYIALYLSFTFRSELPATVVRWANVRWKCVPDDRSRNGETSLADGRVCPRNEQVAAASRTEWPTWQIRDWADDLPEVDRTGTLDTVERQSSNLELYPRSDWQPVKSVTKHRCNVLVWPCNVTLDDLDRPKRTVAEKRFTSPIEIIGMKIDPYYQRQNVGQRCSFLKI